MSTKLSEDKGWCGDRSRGAGMGRPSDSREPVGKCRIKQLRLVDGGAYDEGGAYWGHRDNRLYMISDAENPEKIVVEACSRVDAMHKYEQRFAAGSVTWRNVPKSEPYDELLAELLPHYIKALMFSGTISYSEKSKYYDCAWDNYFCFSDFTEETIETFRKEIAEFLTHARSKVELALKIKDVDHSDIGHALGMEAAETGCGFGTCKGVDRLKLGAKLSELADKVSWSKDLWFDKRRRIRVE